MKNTKRCPKCQSNEIILISGKREAGGAGNLISVSRWNIFDTLAPVFHVALGLEAIRHHLVAPEVWGLHDVSLQHTPGFVVVLGIERMPAKGGQDRGVVRRLLLPFVDIVLDLVPRQFD